MFLQIPERRMNSVRWILTIGWLLVIASLFYDPWSVALTEPDHPWSPLRLSGECVKVQGQLFTRTALSLGRNLVLGRDRPFRNFYFACVWA
jgi:hypothetical protein